uniref:DUF7666 domain-containing protein n=1 Tax=Enterocloster clostridioformis TaxID=1531 RepID=UPI0025A4EA9A|nr:hypothetical protein [Enterocloster clostridioformis]
MKAYKGFKNNMTCRGFQYEEGKEYHEERALCCDTGFHACEYPLDCFKYYEPADSVYHEVEQTGDIDKSEGDSKVASTEIKIGAKIGIPGLVQAAIEYTSKRCEKKAENHNTGYRGASSNTGYWGASFSTGEESTSYAGCVNSVAAALGLNAKAKGVKGAYIICAEFETDNDGNYRIKGIQLHQVDGEKIKEETYYQLIDGVMTEVD